MIFGSCQNLQQAARIWNRYGPSLLSKLLPAAPAQDSWRHCADEGQICLCLGVVRLVQGAEEVGESLVAKNGLVFCGEETFGGATAPRHCECRVAPGPLVVPGNETRRVSNVSIVAHEEGRFIRSQPYSDDFLNGVRYDYASMHAGARLVTHSKGLLHAKAVLSPDKSLYMLAACSVKTWFVIGLLEDLFLEYVGLVTLELFASGYRHVQILGSNQYPTESWRLLGEVESNSSNYELFDVGSRCKRLGERLGTKGSGGTYCSFAGYKILLQVHNQSLYR